MSGDFNSNTNMTSTVGYATPTAGATVAQQTAPAAQTNIDMTNVSSDGSQNAQAEAPEEQEYKSFEYDSSNPEKSKVNVAYIENYVKPLLAQEGASIVQTSDGTNQGSRIGRELLSNADKLKSVMKSDILHTVGMERQLNAKSNEVASTFGINTTPESGKPVSTYMTADNSIVRIWQNNLVLETFDEKGVTQGVKPVTPISIPKGFAAMSALSMMNVQKAQA